MAVIEKERVEERFETIEAPAQKRGSGMVVTALAIIALAAVAATLVFVFAGDETATQAVQDFRSEQQILADLANQGYIPAEAVDRRLLKTEALINQGQIPAQTLEPYRTPVEPLFSEAELVMIELAESGQIPREAVDWGDVELKKLVNQGLIPRQALND